MSKFGKNALWLILPLLSGCMVGSDYRPPPSDLSATWSHPSIGASAAETVAISRWWRTFNDPVLYELIEKTRMGNRDMYQAEARVRQVRATVKEAEVQLAKQLHMRELSGGKVPSQFDLDAAEATLARARADLASARAAVTQAQGTLDVNRTDLTKTVVKSPINGVVLKRSVEPGQTLVSQFQAPVLFTLAEDLKQMELQVDVDEADVGLVLPGQHAQFTVDAYPDRNFPAEIIQVRYGSETVEGVVTYKTVLKVDNADLTLRPGMTATALIPVEQKNDVLLVANSVLRFTPPASQEKEQSNRSFLSMLLARPPHSKPDRQPQATDSKTQQVWTLRNSELTPITITKGSTDGTVTEIIAGDVTVGTELVSGQVSKP